MRLWPPGSLRSYSCCGPAPPRLPHGVLFHQMDLNKTEEVIEKLESLHQQPHLWDFLLLLPRLYTNTFHVADGVLAGGHLLHAVLT